MAFTLAPLPYAADALEPHIDARTMEIHHDKHHQAYTDKLNAALAEAPEWEGKSIEEILTNLDRIPEKIRAAVRNNGGGFHNHNLFWNWMSPQGGGEPTGELAQAIDRTFGGFSQLKEQFVAAGVGQFGSGWAWLVTDGQGNLKIMSTPNQDNPIMNDSSLQPILGVDVWEHAYYLKYQNQRPAYLEAWWNVVNWEVVAALYQGK